MCRLAACCESPHLDCSNREIQARTAAPIIFENPSLLNTSGGLLESWLDVATSAGSGDRVRPDLDWAGRASAGPATKSGPSPR